MTGIDVLVEKPKGAKALYVVAHGAGAGMRHAFMTAVATGLADRRIATLRYEFSYMQVGRRRPTAHPAGGAVPSVSSHPAVATAGPAGLRSLAIECDSA